MIINAGKLWLHGLQKESIQSCKLALIIADFDDEDGALLFDDLTEATFAGYVRRTVSTLTAPAIVGGRSVMDPVTLPTFQNDSVAAVTVYGWALLKPDESEMIVMDKFTSPQSIPAGQAFALQFRSTDTEE